MNHSLVLSISKLHWSRNYLLIKIWWLFIILIPWRLFIYFEQELKKWNGAGILFEIRNPLEIGMITMMHWCYTSIQQCNTLFKWKISLYYVIKNGEKNIWTKTERRCTHCFYQIRPGIQKSKPILFWLICLLIPNQVTSDFASYYIKRVWKIILFQTQKTSIWAMLEHLFSFHLPYFNSLLIAYYYCDFTFNC